MMTYNILLDLQKKIEYDMETQINKLFKLYVLNETFKSVKKGKLIINQQSDSMITLNDNGTEYMDKILEKYDSSCIEKLDSLNKAIIKLNFRPWLMVFFEEEYHIAGHLSEIREKSDDLLFANYSAPSNYSIQDSGVPPISILLVKNKPVLKSLSEKSELLYHIWTYLKDVDEHLYWVFVSEGPNVKWYNKIKENDEGLYLSSS